MTTSVVLVLLCLALLGNHAVEAVGASSLVRQEAVFSEGLVAGDELRMMVFGASFCAADDPKGTHDPSGCGFRCALRDRLEKEHGLRVKMLGRMQTGNNTETKHECTNCAKADGIAKEIPIVKKLYEASPPHVVLLHCCYCSFCKRGPDGKVNVSHLEPMEPWQNPHDSVLLEVANLVDTLQSQWPRTHIVLSTLGASKHWPCASPKTLQDFNAHMQHRRWPAGVSVASVDRYYQMATHNCEKWKKDEPRDCFHPGPRHYKDQGMVYANTIAKAMMRAAPVQSVVHAHAPLPPATSLAEVQANGMISAEFSEENL